jgi:hypothetical protein
MKHSKWQLNRSLEESYRRRMSELFQFELGESDNPYRSANILRELANRPEFQERCAASYRYSRTA